MNPTFSDRLNLLFRTKLREDGREYTHEEVARAAGLSVAAISKLRHGQINEPKRNVIANLATFFGVSPNFFFTNEEQATPSRGTTLDMIVLRTAELSEGGKQALLGMLEHIIKLEEGLESERKEE